MLAEAAGLMFNTEVSVMVRLPQGGDSDITAESVKKNFKIATPSPVPQQNNQPKNQIQDIKPTPVQKQPEAVVEQLPQQSVKQNEPAPKTEKEKKRLESDQEKMVMELFDGKYIE